MGRGYALACSVVKLQRACAAGWVGIDWRTERIRQQEEASDKNGTDAEQVGEDRHST